MQVISLSFAFCLNERLDLGDIQWLLHVRSIALPTLLQALFRFISTALNMPVQLFCFGVDDVTVLRRYPL